MNYRKILILLCASCSLFSCSLSNSGDENEPTPDTPAKPSPTYPRIEITQDEGYKVKFNNIGAAYYKVFDNNDYRKEVVISGNKTDEFFYYEPEVVGKHTIYVEAYNVSDKRIKFSDDFDTVEVEPVIAYSPFSMHYSATKNKLSSLNIPLSVWNDAEERYGKQDSHYFYLNNDLEWTARGALSEGEKFGSFANIVEESDFSRTSMMDTIMKNLKDAGSNVMILHEKYAFLEKNVNWSWWYKSDTDNCLLRIMNTAWKYGIKCIITDTAIFSECSLGTEKYTGNLDALKTKVQNTVNSRFLHLDSSESNLQQYLSHKAFYGFNFPDEPFYDSGTYYAIGYASQKINELYTKNDKFVKLPKPVIFTSILPYAKFLFSGKTEYKNYINKYIELTQSDFVCFDLYTYTTMSYGSYNGEYHCNVKVAFEAFNEIMNEKTNLKVCQTINCGNDGGRMAQTYADVYASHLLAAASKYYGYGLFTFSPFDVAGTWYNPAVTYKQERTANYELMQDANAQVKKVKALLNGFDLETMTIDQNPANEYGYGKKLLTTTFSSGNKNATMFVNYETDIIKTIDVTYNITIEKGQEFYLFGKDIAYKKNVAENTTTIKLDKSQTLLVF